MRRIESIFDEFDHVVTYELSDGQHIVFSKSAVDEYGPAYCLSMYGLGHLIPKERVPVMQNGRRIGTVPGAFDPLAIKSRSLLYEPRPGDFTREGDVWIATPQLGYGDFASIPGFQRESGEPK